MNILEVFLNYKELYINGLLMTLLITVLSLLLALGIGILLTLFNYSRTKVLKKIASCYVTFFRGFPLIVQLFIAYFGVAKLTGNVLIFSGFQAGIITFGMNSAAYISENIRAGIDSVDKGQMEAARALGCNKFHTTMCIIIPQASRTILPSLINTTIKLVKDSSIISQIGVADLFHAGYYTMSETFKTFQALLLCMFFYLVIVLILTWASHRVERKLSLAY